MNKKFYLGAILLGAMTLSTGALTSCIDNDEPEGITNLRGAKAELLRAKAAVELAKAETEKQNANWVAALAAIDQAKAKQEEAKAKQEEAKAKQEEAKVAYEQAKSEQEKAKALIAMADAQQAQAAAEANIEAIKAENEVYLQMQKNQLLEAQNKYDQMVAEIEAAKAVLTDEQATKLAALQKDVDKAWKKYTDQQDEVLTAMKNLFDATNKEVDKEETLRDALAKAEAKLEAVNAAYGELKALAENVAPTAWEARRDSLDNYANKASHLEKAELQLQKDEIMQSEEYKAADKEDKAALGAFIAAQQEYNYLANGSKMDCFSEAGNPAQFGYQQNGIHPQSSARSAKQYDLQGASIAINNPTVFTKIQAAIDRAYLTTVDDNYFKVAEGKGLTYDELEKAFDPLAKSGNPYQAKAVAAWADALDKISVTDEEIDADACVANFEKAVADAQKDHNEAVAKWEKAHKTYADQKVAETVSTATIKAAIGLYNANIDALVAAVDAYNTKYDAAVTRLYNVELEKAKIDVAKNAINTELAKTPAVTVGTVTTQTTLAQIDALIDADPVLTDAQKATKKADYKKVITAAWEGQTIAAVKDAEKTAMTNARTNASKDDAVVEADKKIENNKDGVVDKLEADDKGWVNNAYTGSYATIEKAVADFVVAAKDNSEQQTQKAQDASTSTMQESYTGVADADAKKYITGGTKTDPKYSEVKDDMWTAVKYELDDDDNYVNKGHKVVVRTKVSDAAIQAMTAVELDKQKAAENWVNYSAAAFGTDVPKTISIDANGKVNEATNARHTELTEALIIKTTSPYKDENGKDLTTWDASSFKKLLEAKQALAKHQNLEGVNAEIASLKEKVAAAKAAIQEQIAGYTKAVNEAYAAIEPAKKEHQAKHNAASKLTAVVDAAIAAINAKVGEYNTLVNDLNSILWAYYNNVEYGYTDENGVPQKVRWASEFSDVKNWLKAELAKYEKNAGWSGSEGKIKDAEDAVAKAQKQLDRWIADGEFDAVAEKQLALDQAQAYLETLKARYDFALSQLNDYVAALSK